MPSTVLPKKLAPGATIAFVSPSARLNQTQLAVMARATALLTGRGYRVSELFTPDTGIQSSIDLRMAELRTAFTDPAIDAVVCTIGGSTFTELLPALIADTDLHAAIRANPKVVVGYSDITGLHWFLHALTGLRSFYGPGAIPELGEANNIDDSETPRHFCAEHLFRTITDPTPIGDVARSPTYAPAVHPFWSDPASTEPPKLAPTTGWTWIRPGRAQGRLFGGCVTVMARLGGVQAVVPDWTGRIVFIETQVADDMVSGLPLNRVRAGLADLVAQGVFDAAAGVVVGRPFGYDTEEQCAAYIGVLRGHLCEGRFADATFPILFNVDIGHTVPMVTLPYDALAELDSAKDRFAILESAVR
ncbi:hypothetical protein HMPREF1624_02301 [Sporothrix schenckii ATCC 58251]|uniref:LD-carboxypeptidase n=1 Tax=Sporothrix schenckii (strain ATCC 58251 / de Perez 2211183) TaxID=1391915 RepID=U7PZJ6_SPOS1|nr:hypothetical protein HMPREF1624_02301 [Sporothrix schenckii ATCC 58251]